MSTGVGVIIIDRDGSLYCAVMAPIVTPFDSSRWCSPCLRLPARHRIDHRIDSVLRLYRKIWHNFVAMHL